MHKVEKVRFCKFTVGEIKHRLCSQRAIFTTATTIYVTANNQSFMRFVMFTVNVRQPRWS